MWTSQYDVLQIVCIPPVTLHRLWCHDLYVWPVTVDRWTRINRSHGTSLPAFFVHLPHGIYCITYHLFTNFCTMTLAKYSEKWYIYLYSVSFLDILKSDFVIPSCGLLRIKGMGHYIDWFDITEYIQLTLYMMYEVNKEHDKLFWCIDDDGGGKTNFQAYSGLKLADPSFLYSSVAVDLNKLPFCDGCVPLF